MDRGIFASLRLPLLLTALCIGGTSYGQAQAARDWAMYKAIYVNGSFFFAPIFSVGNVPVAVGMSQSHSTPILWFYVDRNSYVRTGNTITMDMVMQTGGSNGVSQLREGVVLDCATRTFLIPSIAVYEGPLATGELKKTRQFMKTPKVSGDLKPEDLAYFCEGPNPAPIGGSQSSPAAPAAQPTSKAALNALCDFVSPVDQAECRGDLVLGMTTNEVIKVLGKPDEMSADGTMLRYGDRYLSLDEKSRLIGITDRPAVVR
jgi:hypothetical protein